MGKFMHKLCLIFLFTTFSYSHCVSGLKHPIQREKPCKQMLLYYHDTLFNGTNAADATSAKAVNATSLGDTQFGMMVVFNDPVTQDRLLVSPPVARALGFYFYDMKDGYAAWFAYTLVFNTTQHRGTLSIMGADMMEDETRDISVVGGTGDFFMARGVVTIKTDYNPSLIYFRLSMDIKLYECY